VVVYPPIPVDDWTVENLPDRIAEIRQLYLDTLKDWPRDEVPELRLRPQPAKKAAAKRAAKKASPKRAAPAKSASKKAVAKAAEAGDDSKSAASARGQS
jgi:putative phosphoserine phosphatase / 1-acylglycerol-3-phosphate O-acyltransferase